MRDINRIPKIINLIRNKWYENPDMRLCQLLQYLAIKNNWNDFDLFYLEDDKLEEFLKCGEIDNVE